ncbi:tRNA lysidine(34) synthetase TilS [Mycobacterium sp. MYCO198283]|uniref:tRNA lysidine(34) synthetase TilS n=1 Tax=Mycobacterium sp. MYCO198283 TaxID=2883505 RepID=UPI001E47F0C1|nr:tRNA lysidine(34) synthetase TilS [Mycobacterium sp. MYCO198283]MCG5431464.1 tRNA lysidine(34) synthetase TilS [Mycobacterium sp. MYCO198283]
MDRPGALAQLRRAVTEFAARPGIPEGSWCVALSGGADSLALTAAAAAVRPTVALIVDHGLQAGSAAVAARAREQASQLGCVAAQLLTVTVGGPGGPEAAARAARYDALDAARDGAPVLLGHTLDDQAETVLLGLGRGAGPRSLAGMRPYRPPWGRPLLGVRRTVTAAACAELGVTPWQDPHNDDPRYRRVRLRSEVLPLLEDVLGGGVAEALARTATALQEDGDALDALAAGHTGDELAVAELIDQPAAVRRRIIRGWLLARGAVDLKDVQLRGVEELVTAWRGQGGVAVGSPRRRQRLVARRRDGALTLVVEGV